ncbi:MAG: hypothetical protein PUB24_00370 [Lachnospiraceae bacterium]|nr:hypothetical protein [Lachnospiraceae bacterium]MDD6191521.1 hypothetical protein [Lachnospiraceae bacterium]
MKKEKEKLFEEKQFDNVQCAQDELIECEKKRAKCKKGLTIAIIATILSLVGYIVEQSNGGAGTTLLVIAFVLALISYIVGGGILVALSTAWKICKVGWFIVPIFPWDLFTGLVAFVVAVIGFFFVPVLFVWINYHQVCKDYDAAEKYLRYYKSTEETA